MTGGVRVNPAGLVELSEGAKEACEVVRKAMENAGATVSAERLDTQFMQFSLEGVPVFVQVGRRI